MRYALNLEFNGHLNNFGVKQRRQLHLSFPLILKPYLPHLQLNVSKRPTFLHSVGSLSIRSVENFVQVCQTRINI